MLHRTIILSVILLTYAFDSIASDDGIVSDLPGVQKRTFEFAFADEVSEGAPDAKKRCLKDLDQAVIDIKSVAADPAENVHVLKRALEAHESALPHLKNNSILDAGGNVDLIQYALLVLQTDPGLSAALLGHVHALDKSDFDS